MSVNGGWSFDLETKPDSDRAMERIYAWYEGEMIDRPPVRFTTHNAEYESAPRTGARSWTSLRDRWFDAEYQVDRFLESLEGQPFLAETFPVFWPNLGPGVYAAFFGCVLIYGEVTAWSEPLVRAGSGAPDPVLDRSGEHFRKLEEMTRLALSRCEGLSLVGYTDFHPGLDCVADWLGVTRLCLDLIEDPGEVKRLVDVAIGGFQPVFDHFDALLKARRQPSVTWMGIPSFAKLHIPSCDIAAMISPAHFEEFCLPVLRREVKPMGHNIFHLDGKGVARHLDRVLEVPEVQAIQWVQGLGPDKPILQWLPLIERIRAAGKSVVLDLELDELEGLIDRADPEGLFLCLGAEARLQPDILKRIERW